MTPAETPLKHASSVQLQAVEDVLAALTVKQRRSVINAVDSGRLEGFEPSVEHVARLAQIATGELRADDLIAQLKARYQQPRQ